MTDTEFTYNTRLLRYVRHHIGQNIHRRRSELKLPLTKFAELTGFSPQLLDHYELGKREITLEDLLKIACSLRVKVRDLL